MTIIPGSTPVPDVVNSLWSREVPSSIPWLPNSFASTVWPSANRALALTFRASSEFVVRGLWLYNGATLGNNFDIGLLNESGSTVLLSTGSTAQSGGTINTPRIVSTTATLFGPGTYQLALAFNGTTGTVFRAAAGGAGRAKSWRWLQAATAFPLSNGLTWTAVASDYHPMFGLTQRTDLPI